MSDTAEPPEGVLAQRLNLLFKELNPTAEELAPGESPNREYTNSEIAAKVNADTEHYPDVTISPQYIGEIRRGKTRDPRVGHSKALAHAFGVNPSFLFDDEVARHVEAELSLLRELRTTPVKTVALRTVLHEHGLSSDQIPIVQALIEQLAKRRQERFPPAAGSSPGSDGR